METEIENEVKICDRCHKEYNKFGEYRCFNNSLRVMNGVLKVSCLTQFADTYSAVHYCDFSFDLCPNCIRLLEKFLGECDENQ